MESEELCDEICNYIDQLSDEELIKLIEECDAEIDKESEEFKLFVNAVEWSLENEEIS